MNPRLRLRKKHKSTAKGEGSFALLFFKMFPLSRFLSFTASLCLLGSSACAPVATPSTGLFVPPAAQPLPSATSQAAPTLLLETPLASPPAASSPVAVPTTATVACTNNLTFNQDLTIPDGSAVQPGSQIDKQWLVTNSGTCSWDASYRFSFVGGDTLGAAAEQALYPARAGTQAVLRILFTAPLEAGTYQSAWQAFSPDGSAFGDAVYMTILVSP